MTFELLIFGIIATVVVLALAVVVFIVGIPFGLDFGGALAIGAYIFAIVLPGSMNLWIAARASDNESTGERVAAAVRGIAMLAGPVFAIIYFNPNRESSAWLLVLAATCLCMFGWSIWADTRYQTQRLRDVGVYSDPKKAEQTDEREPE